MIEEVKAHEGPDYAEWMHVEATAEDGVWCPPVVRRSIAHRAHQRTQRALPQTEYCSS